MGDKVSDLVIRVKQYMHIGERESQDSIREIENQIDDKNMEIRSLFSQNLESVIEHFIKHQQTVSIQKQLQSRCEDFSKRIQKAQQLCHYDEIIIERSQTALIKLREKKKDYEKIRQSVRKLKQTVSCIKQDRYNNGLKHLNSYLQAEPQTQTPLKKTVPIIKNKITQHLMKLMNCFGQTNLPKQMQIGLLCFNKLQVSIIEKTNIYHNFFGRTSYKNTLIRKSSIIGEKKQQAPLRFLKKTKNQELLQKYILRLNIEMNSLKQMKLICKQLGQQSLFVTIITKYMRKTVSDICQQFPSQTLSDLKKVLSNYIGFLLFRREILGHFNIDQENKMILSQIYKLVGQQTKTLLQSHQNLTEIMHIKSDIDIFHKVLYLIGIETKADNYSIVLGQLFKFFCFYSLEEYQKIINQEMNKDNFVSYKTEDLNQKKLIQTILHQKQQYKFTSFVAVVLQIYDQFYDYLVAFVKDSQINKSQLHNQLSIFFERIIAVYGGFLIDNDQTLQIAQGQTNLQAIQTIVKYYSSQLQGQHQFLRISQFSYVPKLDTVVIELRRRMRQLIQTKIQMMMSSYEMQNIWLPNEANESHHDFVEWLFEFIKQTIICLQTKSSSIQADLANASIGYVSKMYWDYLSSCKQFNLLTIYNLERDLLFIYKFCGKYLSKIPDLLIKMRPLQEFYDLMLNNNVQQILQKNKRVISYPSLNIFKVVQVLKKYNRAKQTGGKVRDLRKRVIEDIVKKLQLQLK